MEKEVIPQNTEVEEKSNTYLPSSDQDQKPEQTAPAELAEWQKQIESQFEEVRRDKISFITVCGIFVAIFTFISVEIQILRYICDFYKIIAFTLILPGILLLFIIFLDYIARSWLKDTSQEKSNWGRFIVVILISIGLISVGLWFAQRSKSDWQCNKLENNQISSQETPKELNTTIQLPESIKIQITQ